MNLRPATAPSTSSTAVWATTFTLVGYAFHESLSTAAGYLTHGALALAVLAAAAFAWREHRRARERARMRVCVAAT